MLTGCWLYGSVYLESWRLMSESTQDAKEFYRREGLEIEIKEAPDHIAVELEFVHFLREKELDAVECGDRESAELRRCKRADFLQRHIGAWIEKFARKVRENAQSEFYPIFADMTSELIREEIRMLTIGYGISSCGDFI